MRKALFREMAIMLLAALPMLLLIIACQASEHRRPADPLGAEMAVLPGLGAAAPLGQSGERRAGTH